MFFASLPPWRWNRKDNWWKSEQHTSQSQGLMSHRAKLLSIIRSRMSSNCCSPFPSVRQHLMLISIVIILIQLLTWGKGGWFNPSSRSLPTRVWLTINFISPSHEEFKLFLLLFVSGWSRDWRCEKKSKKDFWEKQDWNRIYFGSELSAGGLKMLYTIRQNFIFMDDEMIRALRVKTRERLN